MPCGTPAFTISDVANTTLWRMTIADDNMSLLATPLGPGSLPRPFALASGIATYQSFALLLIPVQPPGTYQLVCPPIANDPADPPFFEAYSMGGELIRLHVDPTGILYTTDTGIGTPKFVIGQLYPGSRQAKIAVQPGGPGTVVTVPAQTVDEHTGRFILGCSHSSNSLEVFQAEINCQPAKLIVCALCGFLMRVMSLQEFYDWDTAAANDVIIA